MTTTESIPDGIDNMNDYALYLWESEVPWYKQLVSWADDEKTWGLHAYLSLDITYKGYSTCPSCYKFEPIYTATYWTDSDSNFHPYTTGLNFCKGCMHNQLPRHALGWSMYNNLINNQGLGTEVDVSPFLPDFMFPYVGETRDECVVCHQGIPQESDNVNNYIRAQVAFDREGREHVVHLKDTEQCADCKEHFISGYTTNRMASDQLSVEFNTVDNKSRCTLCSENYDLDNMEVCGSCGTHTTYSLSYSEYRGEDLCRLCYEQYIECNDCGYEYYEDDGHACEDNDDDSNEGDGYIHSYSHKPRPIFHGQAAYHMGIELEVERRGDSIRHGEMAHDIISKLGEEVVYNKWDGSLSDGFEIVTHPHSLDKYHALDWTFLDDLKDNGYRSWNTRSCGLHVHVSRSAFRGSSTLSGEAHQLRFLKFIYDNQRQACRIAGRVSQWAKWDDKGNLVAKVKKGVNSAGHYSAVNTENSSTIEVRIFRGSLRKERVLSAIEFVHASVEFTRSLKIVPKDKPLSWSRFVAYVVNESNTYPNLLTIINETFDREEVLSSVED